MTVLEPLLILTTAFFMCYSIRLCVAYYTYDEKELDIDDFPRYTLVVGRDWCAVRGPSGKLLNPDRYGRVWASRADGVRVRLHLSAHLPAERVTGQFDARYMM